VKRWPILIFLAGNIKKKVDINNSNLLTSPYVMLLRYRVKCRSRILAVYT